LVVSPPIYKLVAIVVLGLLVVTVLAALSRRAAVNSRPRGSRDQTPEV
jgi:hypothetical protein